ncbi:MAG: methyltransferase domain-containing protein [Actinomycetota bacterium]|nr:methyltransferase domain-containing protein [Actinomycetota bacterium]
MTDGHHDCAATFWDTHYTRHAGVWSGEPNAVLVAETSNLPSGVALDLGCGEGADAVWLAQHGWHVTGVDISEVALSRAANLAEAEAVEGQITWERHDLSETFPAGSFDLVIAHYLHSPLPTRRALALQQAARAVAMGGALLVVGHASVAPWSWDPNTELPTASEVLVEVGLGRDPAWHTVVCEDRPRQATGPNGEVATITDSVLRLARTQ